MRKKTRELSFYSKKFSFGFYVDLYTLLFWLASYLRLNFDKILTIQTLIITFKPLYFGMVQNTNKKFQIKFVSHQILF